MSKNNSNQGFDSEAMEQLMEEFEMANDSQQVQVLQTRASMRRRFEDLNEETFLEMQEVYEQLDDLFGATNTKIRHLSQDDIDNMVEELLTVRKFSDILSSREDTLKKFAKDIISLDQIEPDITSGSLVSSKHQLRVSKEIRGGKLQIDVNLLKKRLTEEQFNSVTDKIMTIVTRTSPDGKITSFTDITYEVNDKFLEAEMVKGNILTEDVYLSSVASKRTTAIYIRELEN
jgi:hypothetical protein